MIPRYVYEAKELWRRLRHEDVPLRRVRFGAAALVSVVAAGVLLSGFLKGNPAAAAAAGTDRRDFVCSETGDMFEGRRIGDGETVPMTNPRTGEATLYPAERCYWGADGGVKKRPTLVILNESLGIEGPTECPDCGRLVVHGNPRPPSR